MLIFKFYSLFWIRNANGLGEPSSLPLAAGGSRASLSWGLEGPARHTASGPGRSRTAAAAPPAWNLLGSVTAPHAKKQIQMLGPLPSDLKCKLRVTRTQNATKSSVENLGHSVSSPRVRAAWSLTAQRKTRAYPKLRGELHKGKNWPVKQIFVIKFTSQKDWFCGQSHL